MAPNPWVIAAIVFYISMGSTLYFDINVHFCGKVSRIVNIQPERYSYIDLLNDVSSRSFTHLPTHTNAVITMYCNKPGSNERMDLGSDLDVIEMFGWYSNVCVADLYVELSDVHGPEIVDLYSCPPNSNNKLDCVNGEVDSSDHEWAQSTVDISDKDVDWDDGSSDEFLGYGFEEEQIEASSDGLSKYSSSDDGGKDSSSDSDVVTFGPTIDPFDPTKYGQEFKVDGGGKIRLAAGMLFGDANKFREVLREFTIQEGCKIVRQKNEKTRITCRCAAIGCKWRIHASPLADGVTFKIKTYKGDHTCISHTSNFEANSTWIARKMIDALRANPTMSLDNMQVLLHQKYGLEASRIQLYRAKRKALEVIEGNHSTSYPLLTTYASEVRKSNPGSLVKMQCDRMSIASNPVFKRFFISFEAMRTGFMTGCRPFIGIDGCHLKGPYGGVLLTVTALDGNNGLFPIAVGVVESEGRDSWAFFIDHLHTVIGAGTQSRAWTFMSDQQKTLDKVIAEMVPEATHRTCARHLFNNFRKKHPGLLLRRYFWQAARAYNATEFGYAMESIKGISLEAYTWLSEVTTVWSRHAFNEAVKNDHITNNIAESFNHWVGPLRFKPVLTMLEGIRTKLMTRLQKRYERSLHWPGSVGPHVRKRLHKAQLEGRQSTLLFAGGDEYEVLEEGVSHQLHLNAQTCTCREWQISGIPCRHAAAAITHKRADLEDYCDLYFHKDYYLKAHGGIIHPIPDQSRWQQVGGDIVEPPPLRRLPGRPRKCRRRDVAIEPEAGTSQTRRSQTVKCGICKDFGHNKRSCQRAPVRGRPSHVQPILNAYEQTTPNATTQNESQGHVGVSMVRRGRGGGRGRTRGRGMVLGRGRGTSRGLGRGRGRSRGRGRTGSDLRVVQTQ